MNENLKKFVQAGISLAITTTEKVQKLVDELVVRGKEYQETLKDKEATKTEATEATTEAANTEAKTEETSAKTETAGEQQSRMEEMEQKVRRWIDNAISRFGFIRNDDHDKIADRIEKLEEKLSQLAKAASEKVTETVKETADRV